MKHGFRLARAVALFCFVNPTVWATSLILQNFQGVTSNTTSGLGEGVFAPPDTEGAAGPSHYVEFVNGAFAVYNKANGSVVGSIITDSAFWSAAGISSTTLSSGISDPRIVYDAASGHWFASEITTSNTGNQVLIARSNTSDPTAGWKATQFTGNAGFADFDTLGVDGKGVYVGVNNFTSSTGTFSGVSVFSIPKNDLLLATPSVANITGFQNLNANVRGTTLRGVIDTSGGSGGVILSTGAFGVIDLATISGAGAAGATLSATTNITGFLDGTPINARQPDGTAQIDAGDRRMSANAYQIGNLIYAANTISDSNSASSATHDIVHWMIIDASTKSLVTQGEISDPNFDYYYPSIAANEDGSFVVGFNRSGSTGAADDISSYAETCTTTGGVVTCSSPFLLEAGTVNDYHLFGGSGERWGDYSAISLDPTNHSTFWAIAEIPIGANGWGTQITEITLAPEPATYALIGLGLLGILLRRRKVALH